MMGKMQMVAIFKTPEENEFNHELGEFLRHTRQTQGISQKELGRRIGVTFQQIQKYEVGQNRLSVWRLCQIAEVLEIPITYFFAND